MTPAISKIGKIVILLALVCLPVYGPGLLPVAAAEHPESKWAMPLGPGETDGLQLIAAYRQPNSDYSAGHRGVDYLVQPGQTVFAPSDGQVSHVGKVVNRNLISLRHVGSIVTEYEPVCSDLSIGDRVTLGQPIGTVCSAPNNYNHCKGKSCMHFSMRRDGAYLSPLALIGGLSPSRLLPFL
jgi:murein DD-endopeptidase MepM/ murein hydrolase activator NlpD